MYTKYNYMYIHFYENLLYKYEYLLSNTTFKKYIMFDVRRELKNQGQMFLICTNTDES